MLAWFPLRELAWRAVGTRLEVQVAQSTPSSGREQRAIAVVREIGQFLAGAFVKDNGTNRHLEFNVVTAGTIAVRTAAGLTAFGAVSMRVAIVNQRVHIAIRPRPNAAAAAAVTPVRSAFRNELLATKRRAAVAALPGGNLDARFIDELHGITNKKSPAEDGRAFVKPDAVERISQLGRRSQRDDSGRR